MLPLSTGSLDRLIFHLFHADISLHQPEPQETPPVLGSIPISLFCCPIIPAQYKGA